MVSKRASARRLNGDRFVRRLLQNFVIALTLSHYPLSNPEHELIVKMQKKLLAKTSKQKKELDNIAYLLLDQAKILEGEKISDTSNFSKRIVRLMNESM